MSEGAVSSCDRRNAVLNATGETLWGLQANMVAASTVFTVLLRAHGAGARIIGAIPAIEIGMAMLPQVLGLFIFRSRRRLKRHLVFWHMFGLSPILFAMGLLTFFAPRLAPAVYRNLMLGGFLAFMLSMGLMIAPWMDWLAHIFDVRIRGRVMGLAFFGAAVAGTLGAALAGWIIRVLPAPQSYALLYLAAGGVSVISITLFLFIDDPAEREPDVPRSPAAAELLAQLRASYNDPNFRAYLVGRTLGVAGFCVTPFIAVHYALPQGGGLLAGTIVACGAAMTAGQALGNLAAGHLGDARGHRSGVLVGTAFQIAALVCLLTLRGLPGCLAAYAAAGFAAGTWLSHMNLIIETCPHASRAAHISAANLVVAPFGIAFPLLAGNAAERWGTPALFAGSLAFSALALGWFALVVAEPRRPRTAVRA